MRWGFREAGGTAAVFFLGLLTGLVFATVAWLGFSLFVWRYF